MIDSTAPSAPEERPLFSEGGITVTTRRFINGGYSIELDNVKGVSVERRKPRTGLTLLGAIVCGFLTCFMIISAMAQSAMGEPQISALWAIVFACLGFQCLKNAFRLKTFILELHTPSEVNRDLVSSNEALIDRVATAINEAKSAASRPRRDP
jgi:hypothetical protein